MGFRTIHRQHTHLGWDNGLAHAAEVLPGSTLELQVNDASGGQLQRSSTAADVAAMDPSRANPVTGPVAIIGSEPGDALLIDILGFELGGWGWTALIPGFGLLADQFPDPFLHISEYDERGVHFCPDILLPTRPFPGTIGVAPAAPGHHSVIPPRRVGGNMDCRDLVCGTRLRLPVEVPGALLSIGDTHAAQGDGEVCGTAVETSLVVRVRVDLKKQAAPRFPQLELPPGRHPLLRGGAYQTCGIGPDLMQAARDAVCEMIDYLRRERGLEPELGYCLCSVAAHLKLSELVDAPNWMVSAELPLDIFR